MIEVAVSTMCVMFGGAALVAARRWNNTKESDAGSGIAGWIIFIIFVIWFSYAANL